MSPVFQLMCCSSARVVRHWYIITGCPAGVVRHMHPCAGSIWLNSGPLLFGRRPKPGGSPVVYRSIRPRDPDDEYPLCKTRRAVSWCHSWLAGATSSTVVSSIKSYGGAAALFRRHRGHAHFSTVVAHIYCRCRCRFRNSPTRILCRLLTSLSWSQLSLIHHLRSHALPRYVLIWTLFLPRVRVE